MQNTLSRGCSPDIATHNQGGAGALSDLHRPTYKEASGYDRSEVRLLRNPGRRSDSDSPDVRRTPPLSDLRRMFRYPRMVGLCRRHCADRRLGCLLTASRHACFQGGRRRALLRLSPSTPVGCCLSAPTVGTIGFLSDGGARHCRSYNRLGLPDAHGGGLIRHPTNSETK